MTKQLEPNQLDRRLLGVAGLGSSWPGTVSASRQQMFSSHIGQNVPILHPNERPIQTGMEIEYGKYTFNVSMPENGKIVKVFDRYPKTMGNDSFLMNPERVAIYEGESGQFGIVKLNTFCSNHPKFGFEYEQRKDVPQIAVGQHFAKDTIFYDSPAKGKHGEYNFGRTLNMAYMSHPAISDDGFAICRDVLPYFSFRTYERRVVEWGRDSFPLNIYGDDKNYKIFPDIGEFVHPNNDHKGLLMSLRPYDVSMLMIDQSLEACKTVDHYFDNSFYVDGAGGRVVDIIVHHQPPVKGESPSDEMMVQPNRYYEANIRFRRAIVEEYERLKRSRGGQINITPEFQRYLVESMAIIDYRPKTVKENLKRVYKLNPMDIWRVEFVIEYVKQPGIGNKLTDTVGKH